jgi:hypothetical protein
LEPQNATVREDVERATAAGFVVAGAGHEVLVKAQENVVRQIAAVKRDVKEVMSGVMTMSDTVTEAIARIEGKIDSLLAAAAPAAAPVETPMVDLTGSGLSFPLHSADEVEEFEDLLSKNENGYSSDMVSIFYLR